MAENTAPTDPTDPTDPTEPTEPTDKGTPTEPAEPRERDGALERALNRIVAMNADLARQHVRRFGGGRTGEALLRRLDRQYRIAVTASAGAVGASAAVPGIGTAVSAALTAGQGVATLQATMLYVLSYAEATGVAMDDVDRRRVLLMAVLLGETGQQVVEKVLGNSDQDWVSLVGGRAPKELVSRVNRELRRRFLGRFGVRQGLMSVARMLPFGAGAAIGGIAGAASSAAVITSTRRAFGV